MVPLRGITRAGDTDASDSSVMTGISWRAIAIALGVSMVVVGCGADSPPPATAPPVPQVAAWPNLAWVDGGLPAGGDLADGESIVAVAAGSNGLGEMAIS